MTSSSSSSSSFSTSTDFSSFDQSHQSISPASPTEASPFGFHNHYEGPTKICFCHLPHQDGYCSCPLCSTLAIGKCLQPTPEMKEYYDHFVMHFDYRNDMSDCFEFATTTTARFMDVYNYLFFDRGCSHCKRPSGSNIYYCLERIFSNVAALRGNTLSLTPECKARSSLYYSVHPLIQEINAFYEPISLDDFVDDLDTMLIGFDELLLIARSATLCDLDNCREHRFFTIKN